MKERKNVKRKISSREVKLKTLLLHLGMRITDVAKESGFSQSMVTRYIQAKRNSDKLDKYFKELENEYNDMMDRFMMQVRHVEENQRKIL